MPHDKEPLPMDGLDIKEDLTITEHPIQILDTMARVLRNKVIRMCKVQWSNYTEEKATWERGETEEGISPSLR